MNNVLRFPGGQGMAQAPAQAQKRQGNPMQMIMDRFMSGMRPEAILDQMAGPQAAQAKKIISGKNPEQLKSIAYNMAQQRGVRIEDLAAQMGIKLPG